MCSYCFSDFVFFDFWFLNNQGNINVCFKIIFFVWLKVMLIDMVVVVCGVEYECVVEEFMLFQFVNEVIYKFVYCLECLQLFLVMVVVVFNVIIIEFGLLLYLVCV